MVNNIESNRTTSSNIKLFMFHECDLIFQELKNIPRTLNKTENVHKLFQIIRKKYGSNKRSEEKGGDLF